MAAEFSRFGITEPLSSGIDFYTGDEFEPQVTINASGNVVVNAIKIAYGTAIIQIDSNTTTNITKIAFAQANLDNLITVDLQYVYERQDALVSISAEANVVINITKIAFAASSILIDSNATTNATKIAFAAASLSAEATVAASSFKIAPVEIQVSAETTVTTTAIKIAYAAALFSSQVTVNTGAKISLATIRINVLNNTSINTQLIRFSNAITADDTLIRALLLLDNKPITNQNRQLIVAANPIFIENENWAGNISRYYKNSTANAGAKRVFNLNWNLIPGEATDTVDIREARNFLKDIADDADSHTLTIINQDENGITPYTEENITVLITGYSETLIRRYISDNIYLFQCSMTLEEV
jgi:hypothetical protein